MAKKIKMTELVLRDAHQSLFATRLDRKSTRLNSSHFSQRACVLMICYQLLMN